MTVSLKKYIQLLKLKSRRERCFVIAALVIAFGFVTVKFVVDPFLENQEKIQEEIPVKMKQLEKYRQFVAGKSRVENNLKQIQAVVQKSTTKMLSGNTSPMAAADLQDILKTLSFKNHISIKSEKVLDTKPTDFFIQIPVQIEFTTTITNLTNLLYDIETNDKLLIISNLNIRVTNRRNPKDMRTTIVVVGLMKSGKSTITNPSS